VSGSEAECKSLLAFTTTWALLKDAVWRGTCQLPKGALSLSQRRFLVSSPGTSWFYRAAGIAPISSLTQLYAELLLPSNGSTFAALNAAQQLEHVAFIRDQKLLLDDTPYAKVGHCPVYLRCSAQFTCFTIAKVQRLTLTRGAKALAEPLKSLPVHLDRYGVMRRARDLVDCRVGAHFTCLAVLSLPALIVQKYKS
jgi:hypothetical protein